jgi:Protein of unknown function (DUF2442)
MAMLTKTRIPITEADIQAARLKGDRHKDEPLAIEAGYESLRDAVFVELDNGIRFEIKRELLQGLQDATPEELGKVKVIGSGALIAWEHPEVTFTVFGMLQGLFGSRKWMSELGRAGGSMTSERKAAAARANGTKGGRPQAASAQI